MANTRACRLSSIRFSVVIPAFNAARTIDSSIRSVLGQTRQDLEVIVVDDGSTDGTVENVRRFENDQRIRVLRQSNRGPAAARNAGIAAARGQYVSMLDADDLWLPEYLDVMATTLEANPDAPFAYTDAWVLDDESGRVRRTSAMAYQRPPRTALDGRTFFLRLLLHNFVYTSTTLRGSVFDEVGVYDETLSTGEDWDLWLRIAHRGTPPVRAPGLLAIHRNHPSSLATDTRTMMANICEVYRRFAEDEAEDHEVRALATGQLDYWTRRLRGFEKPTPRVRVRGRLGAIKRRVLNRWLWPGRRPDPVERTLRLVGELE
jgi:glycosyltransferase involved in cell wall biosynthesis